MTDATTSTRYECPYRANSTGDLAQCPSGFPGCGCADDIVLEDGPGWVEYERVRQGESA